MQHRERLPMKGQMKKVDLKAARIDKRDNLKMVDK